MKLKITFIVLLAFNISACSWVKLTEGGEKVRVLAQNEVTSCKRIGKTTANVADKVIGLKRQDNIIQDNLDALARNAAAEMKGDTVVPIGTHKDGILSYNVYKCIGG